MTFSNIWSVMSETEKIARPAGGEVSAFTLALNYLPIVYLAAGAAAAWNIEGAAEAWSFILIWIYLIPAIVCRITLLFFGYPEGRNIGQETRAYKVWWFLSQWQVVFNRLPWLEELLRLIPGAYALWLNLWGGRISLFAYWGPGSKILDRYLVRVGPGAVIGAGASITGHLGTLNEDGSFAVDIATVTVCEGTIIGAHARIGPGCQISAHEMVPAGRLLPPFTLWQGGRKIKKELVGDQ